MDLCQIRSIGRLAGEGTVGTGTCTSTAGGSNDEDVTQGGGAIVGEGAIGDGGAIGSGATGGGARGCGCVTSRAGDVGVGNFVVGVGELPLAGDAAVELREDHGSRNRLADLGRP